MSVSGMMFIPRVMKIEKLVLTFMKICIKFTIPYLYMS